LPSTDPRRRPFGVAPDEDLLYSLAADGSRRWIEPSVTYGRYWRLRSILAWGLMALFVGLPHVTIAGLPGIFLDVAHRKFTVFGVTLHPTDNLVLLAFGALVIVTLFAVTSVYGRLWCGYACPHPIYLEFVFRPLETLIEGRPAVRIKRDARPWSWDRAWRKALKWVLYAALSLFLAGTFVAYFVGWHELVLTPLAHPPALVTIVGVAVLIFGNFAYFRDQMCTVACPYGRLQTVLYDQDTVIVGYDAVRGEPRHSLKAKESGVASRHFGDCIDCGRCITTCPTGMDIRRGLQMECIGCAQCIEACDEVMHKIGRAPGLIRYTSLRELETGHRRFLRPRVFVYGVLVLLAAGALLGLTLGREPASMEILRNGREPFRMLPTGEVADMLSLRLTNNLHTPQSFTVEMPEPAGAELVVSQIPFVVDGDAIGTLDVVTKLPEEAFVAGQRRARFVVRSDAGALMREEFVLLGPYN